MLVDRIEKKLRLLLKNMTPEMELEWAPCSTHLTQKAIEDWLSGKSSPNSEEMRMCNKVWQQWQLNEDWEKINGRKN